MGHRLSQLRRRQQRRRPRHRAWKKLERPKLGGKTPHHDGVCAEMQDTSQKMGKNKKYIHPRKRWLMAGLYWTWSTFVDWIRWNWGVHFDPYLANTHGCTKPTELQHVRSRQVWTYFIHWDTLSMYSKHVMIIILMIYMHTNVVPSGILT